MLRAVLVAVLCGVAVDRGHAAANLAIKGYLNIGGVFPLLQASLSCPFFERFRTSVLTLVSRRTAKR
jgi:hypothetical protein